MRVTAASTSVWNDGSVSYFSWKKVMVEHDVGDLVDQVVSQPELGQLEEFIAGIEGFLSDAATVEGCFVRVVEAL